MKHLFTSFMAIGLLLFSTANAQEKEIAEAIEGNNTFCFEWLSSAYQAGENQVFSPQSISIALSMAYDGAKWRTKWEMAKVMHFQSNAKKNQAAWAGYIDYFDQIKTPLFHSANAVWLQKDYHFLESYVAGIENYKAQIKAVDFVNTVEREKSRKKMNQWVESKTKNKIKQLIRKGDLDDQTRLVLINAIYFYSEWEQTFPENMTHEMIFQTNEKPVKTDFMNIQGEYNYMESDLFTIVEVPYRSGLSSMYILLPKRESSMTDLLSTLDYESFSEIISNLTQQTIRLSMPKFHMESRTEMKKQFIKMGMQKPFSAEANFRGINGKKNLMIDEVIHQAMIDVNEKGTEASAATAVIMREKGGVELPHFLADRPFVFIIKENKKGSILFAGVLENPIN